MKILYLHQYFTTPAFGGGTRSYEMARRLAAAGHEVTLLTSSAFLDETWAPGPGWHAGEADGVRVEVYRLPYSNRDAGTCSPAGSVAGTGRARRCDRGLQRPAGRHRGAMP